MFPLRFPPPFVGLVSPQEVEVSLSFFNRASNGTRDKERSGGNGAVRRVKTGLIVEDGVSHGHGVNRADGLVFVAENAEPEPAVLDGVAAPFVVERLGLTKEGAGESPLSPAEFVLFEEDIETLADFVFGHLLDDGFSFFEEGFIELADVIAEALAEGGEVVLVVGRKVKNEAGALLDGFLVFEFKVREVVSELVEIDEGGFRLVFQVTLDCFLDLSFVAGADEGLEVIGGAGSPGTKDAPESLSLGEGIEGDEVVPFVGGEDVGGLGFAVVFPPSGVPFPGLERSRGGHGEGELAPWRADRFQMVGAGKDLNSHWDKYDGLEFGSWGD